MLSDSIILYHQLFFCSCLESCGLHHLTSQMMVVSSIQLGYQKVVLGLIVLPCYPHSNYTNPMNSPMFWVKASCFLLVESQKIAGLTSYVFWFNLPFLVKPSFLGFHPSKNAHFLGWPLFHISISGEKNPWESPSFRRTAATGLT